MTGGEEPLLYRRIRPGEWESVDDRPRTSSFQLRSKRGELGISVFRSDRCSEEDVLEGHQGFGLVGLPLASIPLDLELVEAPLRPEQDSNPRRAAAHCEIRWKSGESRRFPQSLLNRLVEIARNHIIGRPAPFGGDRSRPALER